MKGQDRILSLWAYVAVDHDGTEGVVAANLPGMGWTPLVGADLARIKSLRPYAQAVATLNGLPVTLVHFSQRTNGEVLRP